jgi:DNA-binding MarR family transcriptional regulator
MQDSLHYKLRKAHALCQKNIMQEVKKNSDLRSGEPKILEFLFENEPCEQKAIAEGCELDPASITGILGRMEERGLISRDHLPKNRRSLFVSMTDKGREMHSITENAFNIIDKKACSGLSAEQTAEIQQLLEIICTNLKTPNDL